MAEAEDQPTRGRKRRLALRAVLVLLMLALAALALAWFQRREIAHDLIGDALREAGVSASYTVETISPELQVLRDITIGDPARPDFTARRVELETVPRFGLPGIARVRVIGGRLYGSYREGELSFGQLDPLIFTGEDEPFAWPDLELSVEDGRGLIESDFGRVGLRLTGAGHLQSGFTGELAAVAPSLAAGGCTAARTTLFGAVRIEDEQPRFAGPLRFASLNCAGARLADGAVQVDASANRELTQFAGDLAIRTGAAVFAGNTARATGGEGALTWREGSLTARYDLAAETVVTPFARMARATLEGSATAADGFTRLASEGELRASGVDLGDDLDTALAGAARASEGTLAAPLLARIRGGLARELDGATLAAEFTARRSGEQTSVVIPQAALRGGSGAILLALSRAQVALADDSLPRFSGNLATGGDDLPRIAGRMEQAGRGPLSLRLKMNEYAAGNARLALPDLTLTQGQGGRIALAGEVHASGALPGGVVSGLVLPVDGTISADGALALWNGCRIARFDRLELAGLTLGRQSLRLCPPRGAAILRYGARGLQVAAGTDSLQLAGELGNTPVSLASGAVGFAWPGRLAARGITVKLGPPAAASRFVVSELTADISGSGIAGGFTGADVFLAAVPLDIRQAGGAWTFADGRLDLSGASFTLEDREQIDRFTPLTAQGASLSLRDSHITAEAALREGRNGSVVARVGIMHNLTIGNGSADFRVDGVTFRPDGLQPRDLSELAYGVVSVVAGTVSGEGRIAWGADSISSGAVFTTAGLDFAAPFGPVTGASGTVVFTDLLSLTTAPNQQIALREINPGIAINNGVVGFSLTNGEVVAVSGGTWPYLGGTIRLLPVTLNIGAEEERTYTIVIEGLEAGRFVENMELNNLAASGVFDGTIPIVFDAMGNGHLTGGILTSRPGGGNLAYIGQLTYEDLGYMGNLAFSALRDLKFDRAEILLDGPLTGELVTRVNFEGIGQGALAEGNFITRRIAQLPIELRINIRAPFYQLISTTRSLYDPAALRDPRGLGLLGDDGTRLRARADSSPIQPPESEAMR